MKKTKSVDRKARKFKLRPYVLNFSLAFFVLSLAFKCCAQEITIIYTGQTHGMIYSCSCPIEPDGGIARRATLIKQIRNEHPDSLLLDSGDFFAGGLQDEYTQNTQLDADRSLVNLKAMELMKYDAVAVGDDEFNFGRDFLQQNIGRSKLAFVSCNLKFDNVAHFVIKEVAGVKIGIIGVTPLFAQQKAGGLELSDPKPAVSTAVKELKKGNADIIVALSQLQSNENNGLVNDISGIDILIEAHPNAKEPLAASIGNTLLLRPSWEGRRLNFVTLTIEGNKIAKYKAEERRLSDQVTDDQAMLSILPQCFSDANCGKEGSVGACKDPGSLKSKCEFKKANKVSLLVITPKDCMVCDTNSGANFLKKQFPGLAVSYIYYPDKKADNFIKDFNIVGLPAYFLGKEAEKEGNFAGLKADLTFKGDYYMVKSQFSGFSFFLNRKNEKGRLDLFVSLYDKTTPELLDVMKEFDPRVHLLALEQNDKFEARNGDAEIEEYLRAACIQQYYPRHFWDYISCRSRNIGSSWWEDCAKNLDADKIKICARSSEGSSLLRENIRLNKELGIMFGPTYLLDNQQIFGSKGAPSKEELKKIIKR